MLVHFHVVEDCLYLLSLVWIVEYCLSCCDEEVQKHFLNTQTAGADSLNEK